MNTDTVIVGTNRTSPFHYQKIGVEQKEFMLDSNYPGGGVGGRLKTPMC